MLPTIITAIWYVRSNKPKFKKERYWYGLWYYCSTAFIVTLAYSAVLNMYFG